MRAARVIERMLSAIPIMLGVAIIVFLVMRVTPGDPIDSMMGKEGQVSQEHIDALRREFNLDKPLLTQLRMFLTGACRGDLGNSLTKSKPVAQMIIERFPATVELSLGAILFALAIGIPVGVISAVKQNSWIDRACMSAAFLGVSMPPFWLGIVLIIVLSVRVNWFAVSGRITYGFEPADITHLYVLDSILTANWKAFVDSLSHLTLPSITLGAPMCAVVARLTRSSMLEALRQDYIVLARSKGLAEARVIVRHALRNALIPTVTVAGVQAGVLLGGNMVVERVFGWPGIGQMAVAAIFERDYPIVQGVVMVYGVTFVVVNLLVDIIYTLLNPRLEL